MTANPEDIQGLRVFSELDMSIFDLCENLIFPPKCANCRELLDIDINKKHTDPLCPQCRLNFEHEKSIECSSCGLEMRFCRCMPAKMNRAQCTCLLKLMSYKPNDDKKKINQFVYSIKHSYNKVSFAFVAEQMRACLINEMRACSLMPEDCVITYMPRSHKNKATDGFDQSFELASALSRITGIPLVKCFKRKLFSKQQRDLNSFERQLNMRSAYTVLDVEDRIKGKTLILVDDIVTTGSSMAACARLLYSEGAYAVMGVSLGLTEKNNKNKR